MKAVYLFFSCIALLTTVACSNLDQNKEEDVVLAPVMIPQADASTISLDSFQRSVIYTLPGTIATTTVPKNKLYIHREKDSITISGTVYSAPKDGDKHKALQSYQFYFKSAANHSYAYLKYNNYMQTKTGEKKLQSREAGYSLKMGVPVPVQG